MEHIEKQIFTRKQFLALLATVVTGFFVSKVSGFIPKSKLGNISGGGKKVANGYGNSSYGGEKA